MRKHYTTHLKGQTMLELINRYLEDNELSPISDGTYREILDCIDRTQRVQAIKLLREASKAAQEVPLTPYNPTCDFEQYLAVGEITSVFRESAMLSLKDARDIVYFIDVNRGAA